MPPRRIKKSQNNKSKKGKKERESNAVDEQKKELLLSDFKNQVQKHIAYMSREAERMCAAIRSIYHKEIILLPKKIREMTMKEYFEQGGGINGLCVKSVKEEISTAVSQNVSSVLSKVQMKQNQENENYGNTIRSTRVLRPRKVKTTTVKTRITRSTSKILKEVDCNVETTPYNFQSLMKTPMITPKFDPSLPTPAVLRKPRFGEVIVSMAGSPLHNVSDLESGPGVLVSLGGGKVISITDKTALNKNDIENLDEMTKSSLLAVKEKLNKLLQIPE